MVHFLRDASGYNIVESELYNKTEDGNEYTELHSCVDITGYSLFLLNDKVLLNSDVMRLSFIEDIDFLSELRGWLWEIFYMIGRNDGTKKKEIEEKVGEFYKNIAKTYNLYYVTD